MVGTRISKRNCVADTRTSARDYGDLTDSKNLVYSISSVRQADGAQRAVARQGLVRDGRVHGQLGTLSTLRLLDAIRMCGFEKVVRFVRALRRA